MIAAACSVFFGHNHPTGYPTPSEADVSATLDLVGAGKVFRISVNDHIIVGEPEFISLRQFGMIG